MIGSTQEATGQLLMFPLCWIQWVEVAYGRSLPLAHWSLLDGRVTVVLSGSPSRWTVGGGENTSETPRICRHGFLTPSLP